MGTGEESDMENIYIALSCPSCNAAISENDRVCPYCGRSLVKKKNFLFHTEQELSGDVVDVSLMKTAELLKGRKPFLCSRYTIDQCIDCLDKAYEIKSAAIIDYFRAYIEYDYFERKHLKRNPGYEFYLLRSQNGGITKDDIEKLELLIKNQIQIGGDKINE